VHPQPSQETQDGTDVEEASFVERRTCLQKCGIGDVFADTGFISGVDHLPIAIGFIPDVDPSFIELEFMLEYEAAFRDERAEDSVDDRLVPELSNMDKVLLQRALAEHAAEMQDCRDPSQAHRAVVDGL
jgi:hypothetical protein